VVDQDFALAAISPEAFSKGKAGAECLKDWSIYRKKTMFLGKKIA